MATIHISEAEAARDFAALMVQVRAGAEVVIEDGARPVAVIRAPSLPRRSISESLTLAEASSKELGYTPVMDVDFAADMERQGLERASRYTPVMDVDFAADMEEIIRNRKPRRTSAWE